MGLHYGQDFLIHRARGTTWAVGSSQPPPGSDEATLWVNGATGSDANTIAQVRAGEGSVAWATIGRAAWGSTNRAVPNASEAADAGDVVSISAGTYASSVVVNDRHVSVYNPINQGTSGSNLLTFTAAGAVVLQATSADSPVIGSSGRNYVKWSGPFDIDEAVVNARADTGGVVLDNCTGCVLDGLQIDGNGDPGWGDNHTGVRCDFVTDCAIRNCTIHDVITSGVNGVNGAGVEVYGSDGLTIEHNHIYSCGSGVFFKAIGVLGGGDPSDAADFVRLNLIHDCSYGIVQLRQVHTAADIYFLVSQNVIYGCGSGITLWKWGEDDGPSNGRFVNNTIDDCDRGLYLKTAAQLDSTANCLFVNNLVTNCTVDYAVQNETNGTIFADAMLAMNRNLYYTFSPNFILDFTTARSFSGFTGLYTTHEVNGVAGTDPVYADQPNRNYHISGATALSLGRVVHSVGGNNGDTIPAGAYIAGSEVIGPAS